MPHDLQRLDRAAALMERAVHSGTHPSAVAATADRRQILWTHVVPGEDAVTLESVFPVASITKPVVAVALLQLVERGALLLSDPVAKFLPEFGAQGKGAVSAWHLLTHTGGLDESPDTWERLAEQQAGHEGYLEAACRAGLRYAPGTQATYTNLSFVVLGELITRLSGMPYPEYLRDHIFAPLGMRNTAFGPTPPDRAVPVHTAQGRLSPERLAYGERVASPAGGLWSSAADLTAFGQALLGAAPNGVRLPSAPALEAMSRLHTGGLSVVVEGRPLPWLSGLGCFKPDPRGSLASPASFGHGGATGTLLWVDPAHELVFVFLSNRWGLDHDVPNRLLNAVYGALG